MHHARNVHVKSGRRCRTAANDIEHFFAYGYPGLRKQATRICQSQSLELMYIIMSSPVRL